LRVIADISMDIEGAVEATVRATDPGDPVYLFDAARRRPVDGITGNGPLILAVDNLPCQLAAESSQHFGDALIRFAPALDRCDWTAPLAELALPAEMTRAVVVHHGALAPDYANLRRHLETA
jgi:alpha-aminoadipic semialdehyde synthase